MKNLGILLVALGLLALVYGGFDYNRNRTVMQVGSMEIATSEHRTVSIPLAAGLAVLIGGIAIMVTGTRRGARS